MSSISPNQFRVHGPVISLAESAKSRPSLVRKMTAAQIQEDKLYHEQVRLREDAMARYAQAHSAKIYGQVVVGGKVFATVFDSGCAATQRAVPMTNEGSGEALAKARLADIARAVKGEIRYSNFLPNDLGGGGCTIPDDVMATFPKITARPGGGFLEELAADADRARVERARSDCGAKPEGQTPRPGMVPAAVRTQDLKRGCTCPSAQSSHRPT